LPARRQQGGRFDSGSDAASAEASEGSEKTNSRNAANARRTNFMLLIRGEIMQWIALTVCSFRYWAS